MTSPRSRNPSLLVSMLSKNSLDGIDTSKDSMYSILFAGVNNGGKKE